MTEPQTLGVHHVGLTVPNIHDTQRFFTKILGFEQVGEVRDYPAVFLSDGAVLLTLWQASDPESAIPFDRKRNVGLHHVALRVADVAALRRLDERLRAAPEVEVDFHPEPLGDGPTQHMTCTIPGGIRVELIAPAAAS